MEFCNISILHDHPTVWRAVADTVIALIKENTGEPGVPDIVSAVAQYAHFSDGPENVRRMFHLWLADRLNDTQPFVVLARIPRRQTMVLATQSRNLIVGAQEQPWPAFSIWVSDAAVEVQLLDARVRARYDSFCDMLSRRIGSQND